MAPRRPGSPKKTTSGPPRPAGFLGPDDEALWQRIKDSTKPLEAHPRHLPAVAGETSEMPPAKRARRKDLAGSTTASKAPAPSRPPPSAKPAPAPIERRLARRLSRGAAEIEARLDLHGMRQQEAQQALHRFLLSAQVRGQRLVLVITGKGSRGASEEAGFMPDRDAGVLRRALPRWLELPQFRELVISCAPAHRRDGGEGAFYLRLRKARN
jgi:DNA-nicking Smr family endonuclease